jgi:hypothetical protein
MSALYLSKWCFFVWGELVYNHDHIIAVQIVFQHDPVVPLKGLIRA